MELLPLKIPLSRTPRRRTDPIGRCIYCGASGTDVALTDEHIVPDGLGGDLIIPDASCKLCAQSTSRAELHLLREIMQFARGVAGVSSRKRKSPPSKAEVKLDGSESSTQLPLTGAPFVFPFPTTDELPGILRGSAPGESRKLRISLFGPKDWNERGKKWLGGTGTFKYSHRLHAGVMGQALAKIAHSYACAVLGAEAFIPLLTDYIRAKEPPFDGHHIGIYPSGDAMDCLHYLDLQTAKAPQQTVLGIGYETVFVVAIRLFANQPSPSSLVVVGRPNGAKVPELKQMDLTAGVASNQPPR